jgi:hypothetical protein
VTHRESRIEGTGVTAPGRKVSRRDNIGTFEALVSCGKNEAIPGEAHHPTAVPHHSENIYGSNSKSPTCTG